MPIPVAHTCLPACLPVPVSVPRVPVVVQHLLDVLRKARMDTKMLEFFPQQARRAYSAGCTCPPHTADAIQCRVRPVTVLL